MSGKILITGGAQRFGRALALALAAEGYEVSITYRRQRDNLKDLEEKGIQCLQADFSSTESINAFVKNFAGRSSVYTCHCP